MARFGGRVMMRLDLREEVQGSKLSLGEPLPPLADPEMSAVQRTWRGRMVNEHISAQVFAGLIPQLMRAGASAKRQSEAAEMIADELRHARLCAEVLWLVHGEPVAELPEIESMPQHEDAAPLEALLRNLLSVCCLSETVAVSLISAERLASGPEAIAGVLKQILADEVRHARFGWKVVDEIAPTLSPQVRDRLSAYLRVAFAHLEAHELAHLGVGPEPSPEAMAIGLCDGREARRLFYDTVEGIIVPRLEAYGFEARGAWRHREAV
jgi:hypothetical protein